MPARERRVSAGLILDRRSWRLTAHAFGIVMLAATFLTFDYLPDLSDGYSYWSAWQGGLYDKAWLEHHAYVYSPAFAQAIWPLTLLSWPLFDAIWMLGQMAVGAILVGPLVLAFFLDFPAGGFVQFTIERGNIHFFLAGAVTFALLRWPALWAFVIHTKPTMGITLAWYIGRADWKGLRTALIATVVVGLVSFAIAPGLWFDWVGLIADGAGISPTGLLVPRILMAGLIALAAGMTNQRWPVPIAAFSAAPTVWAGSSEVMFFAAIYLGWRDWRDGTFPFAQWRKERMAKRQRMVDAAA